ncbi:hypothetical protein C0991_005363 [Blastosporella zonata]|nr:hypothetical protein C0991_005363 [Blastosporella zonata]
MPQDPPSSNLGSSLVPTGFMTAQIPVIVNERDYQTNRQRIAVAEAQLQALKQANEDAKRAYDKQCQDLLRVAEAGRAAELQLQELTASMRQEQLTIQHTSGNHYSAQNGNPSGSEQVLFCCNGLNISNRVIDGSLIRTIRTSYDTTTGARSTAPVNAGGAPVPSTSIGIYKSNYTYPRYSLDGPSSSAVPTAVKAFNAPPSTNSNLLDATKGVKVSNEPTETPVGAAAMEMQAKITTASTSSQPMTASTLSEWSRFCVGVATWARNARAPCKMPLQSNTTEVNMDATRQVYITIRSNGQGPKILTFEEFLAVTQGPHNLADTAKTGSNRKSYHPSNIPQHEALPTPPAVSFTTNAPAGRASVPPTVTPDAPTTPRSFAAPLTASGITPKQADKKTMAKDLLHALKRPQPDDKSAAEPPAKRPVTGTTPPPSGSSPRTALHDQVPPTQPHRFISSSNNLNTTPYSSQPLSKPVSSYYRDTAFIQADTVKVQPDVVQVSKPVIVVPPPVADATRPQTSASGQVAPAMPAPSVIPPQATALESALQHTTPASQSTEKLFHNFADPSVPTRPKTPLFLPSPSSLPDLAGASPIPESNFGDTQIHTRVGPSFYVLVPSANWVRQYKIQMLGHKRRIISASVADEVEGIGSFPPSSTSEGGVEEIEVIDLDPANDLARDGAQREAVLLSCSRLIERPCKWNGCSAILSSTEQLIRHFAYAHREIFEDICICRWQQCGHHAANWSELFQHLKGHALIPLQCGYENCEQTFRTPRQLARHHQEAHSNDTPKPSASLVVPAIERPADVPPIMIPSYMVEPVQQPSISKERHGNLGPWVLRQIAGSVNLEVKRYNAASKLQQSPSSADKRGNQPYDFLSFPSTNHSSTTSQPSKMRGMEDLMSLEVSDMAHKGLVLWGPPKKEEEEVSELFPSSPIPQPRAEKEEEEEEEEEEEDIANEQMDVDAVQVMPAN